MTAEEVALDRFRFHVAVARLFRLRDILAYYAHRKAVYDLARIIRAIRAEREERGDMVGAFGQGIRTAYEQGRRDALRGVQGACLFEGSRITRHTVTSPNESIVALGAIEASAYRRVAKAAEEAAR